MMARIIDSTINPTSENESDYEDNDEEEDIDYAEAIDQNHLEIVHQLDFERQFIFR